MSTQYTVEVFRNLMRDSVRRLDGPASSYLLNILLSGEVHYIIDGRKYIQKGGDAVFLTPGIHRIRKEGTQPVHFFLIKFKITEPSALQESSEPLSPEISPLLPTLIPDCVTEPLKELLFLADKLSKNHSGSHTGEKLSHLLELVILSLQESVESQSQNPHIQTILQYIRANYTRKITLQDIADSAFLSVPYCCNLVKKELGTTVNKLILKERVLLAQEYLLHGDIPLQEIPYLCGFTDYCHFSKCFKEFTGCPPSRYKSNTQTDGTENRF